MSAPVIEVSRLVKRLDRVLAVNDISFRVGQGGTTALLGGNGAGKTTTLSMLAGLLLPTSGSIRVMGVDMLRDRYAVSGRVN